MFGIIICEMKKFKRMWIPLIIGVFALIKISTIPLNTNIIKNADQLFIWTNMEVFSYGFLAAINILTAYVFLYEFKNNTMVVMTTYKHERWKIFIAKIITIIIVSLLLYMIEFGIITTIGFISFSSTLTAAVLTKHFILTMQSFIFQMLMITITACIALTCKNLIGPIIYIGVQLVLSFIFFMYAGSRAFIPFALPVVSNLMLVRDTYKIIRDISIMPSTVSIAVIMFAVGLVFGCLYINKMEIS